MQHQGERSFSWDEAITPPDDSFADPYHYQAQIVPDVSYMNHSTVPYQPIYMPSVSGPPLFYPSQSEFDPSSYMPADTAWPLHTEQTLGKPPRVKSNRRSQKLKDRKKCTNCGATKTPSWRRGGNGGRLLCNACGLYEKVNGRRRQVFIQPDGSTKVARGGAPDHEICKHCKTHDAKRWRRIQDQTFCDRCATLHDTKQPWPLPVAYSCVL